MKKVREVKVEIDFQKQQNAYPLGFRENANMTDIQTEVLGTRWFHMHEILLKTKSMSVVQ